VITGDIIIIHKRNNQYDGAECVYIGPWENGKIYHEVVHLTEMQCQGKWWYRVGTVSHWDEEDLISVGQKASWCANCEQWFKLGGSYQYLCRECKAALDNAP
jgi:hypothetical protein